MPYPLPLTRTEAYLAYKAGVVQQSDLKPSLAVPRNGIDAWLAYWTGLAEDYPKREDGTPHILQEEEAYIAYICGVINEYPEKCLRRVGAYLRYLISARWGRPDHPLNREELYLSLIKTQFIPSGDPSSDIVIDGTAKAPFVDVKMYGDTYQQTYTGKNLWNTTPYKAGYYISPSGVETADGNTSIYGNIETSPNTTYTLTVKNLSIAATVRAHAYDENGEWINQIGVLPIATNEKKSMTFTTPANTKYLRWSFWEENRISDGQVELGSTETSFEPYVGGVPSPNPDYPQPIQTVTGEQTVEIVGKNLFDISKANMMVARLNSSGGITLDITNRLCTVGYIGVKPSTTYTFNALSETSGKTLQAYIVGYSELGSGTAIGNYPTNAWYSFPITFTTGSDCRFIRISYRYSDDSTMATTSATNQQLELGSTASNYAPYTSTDYHISLGDIELCNIGGYQDYIHKVGEDWIITKRTTSILLNEYSSIYRGNFGTNPFYTALPQGSGGAENTKNVISDYFYGIPYTDRTLEVPNSIFNTFVDNSPVLYIRNTPWATIEDFKSWLSEHNVKVYSKRTPINVTITDTTLISQLEALLNGGAENGTTYIKVNATDPNLPAKLYVEAPKYD